MRGHQLQRVLALGRLVLAGFQRGMGKECDERGDFLLGFRIAIVLRECRRGIRAG